MYRTVPEFISKWSKYSLSTHELFFVQKRNLNDLMSYTSWILTSIASIKIQKTT